MLIEIQKQQQEWCGGAYLVPFMSLPQLRTDHHKATQARAPRSY